jgi:hypothetical protein
MNYHIKKYMGASELNETQPMVCLHRRIRRLRH